MTPILPCLLAVLAGLLVNVGTFIQKVRALQLPALGLVPRLGLLLPFFKDPLWMFGNVCNAVGFGLYLFTLKSVPLSVAQPLLASGVIVLVVCGIVFLKEKATTATWIGIVMVCLGVIALGATLTAKDLQGPSAPSLPGLAILYGIVIGLMVLVVASEKRTWSWLDPKVGSGILSGLFLGSGAVLNRAVAGAAFVEGKLALGHCLMTPWPYAWALLFAAGAILLQRAHQQERAVVVLPICAGVTNVLPVLAGLTIYGETLPEGVVARAVRLASFAIIFGGMALILFAATLPRRADSDTRAVVSSQ